jgi:hypothetical protein
MVDRLPKEKNWILHHHIELKANSLQKDPIGVKIKKYKVARVWGGGRKAHIRNKIGRPNGDNNINFLAGS